MSGRVLVTGARGFVGRNVIDALLLRGRAVVGFSAPVAAGSADIAAGNVAFVDGDVRDDVHLRETMRAHGVTEVIHLAALTPGADDEMARAQSTLDVNVGGTAALLAAAAACGVARFVFVSSIAVYGTGQADGSRLDEDAASNPQTLYAISKDAAERVVRRLGTASGLDWRIGRLGRVFGPWEHDTGVRATMSQIHVATEAARAGRRVRFARPCRKAWHYAPDAAAAVVALMEVADPADRTCNLGNPGIWSLQDWCDRLRESFPGFDYDLDAAPASREDVTVIDLNGATDGGNLSFDRYERMIGRMPTRSLDAAFAHYVAHLRATSRETLPA